MHLKLKTTISIVALALSASAASAQEIRFMCHSQPTQCGAMMMIFEKYEAENPGVDVVLDQVSYQTILESLPIQLAGGEGPDMSTVTDFGGLNQFFLDLSPYVDNAYWEENFGNFLPWYRRDPNGTDINAIPAELAVTGAFINRTLFDQAGVDVPPEGSDWDTWAAASREVAEKTGTTFAMAMDRSGHRIAGPAIAYGARYFDENDEIMLVDDAFTEYVAKFVAWHQDGTFAQDVWGGGGGTTYRNAGPEFINGDLVYYFSGSWQVPRFEEEIGDLFDWQVVGSPCGAGGCTGMPGGAGITGFKHTEHPEIVAGLLDFLAQEDNYAAYSAAARYIPAHAGVAAKGVEYEGLSPLAAKALQAWGAEVAKLERPAIMLQGYINNRAVFNITLTRVSQAIAGEMTVEEAVERMKEDLEKALAEVE